MTDKYGFGEGIELPKLKSGARRPPVDDAALSDAVQAGRSLGFVDRDPALRRKPGPKRTELQDKISIPGPKRTIDAFRDFCVVRDLTLWQGLEALLNQQNLQKGRGG